MFFGVGCCSLLGFVMEALLALILWDYLGCGALGEKTYRVFI